MEVADMKYTVEYLEDVRAAAPREVADLAAALLDGEMTMAEFEEAAAVLMRRWRQ